METKVLSMNEIAVAAQHLLEGQVVGFPTETVYGLGVIYDDERAFQRLMDVKNRPEHKPFTVMCADFSFAYAFADISMGAERVMKKYMPGPLTIILPLKKELHAWVTAGSSDIGIRISSDEFVRNLIAQVGKPLLVPSANKSGKPPLVFYQDVYEEFKGEIAAVFAKDADNDAPSTIVKISMNHIECIREGSLSFKEIEACWKGESK